MCVIDSQTEDLDAARLGKQGHVQFNVVSALYIFDNTIPLVAFLMLLECWGYQDIEFFAIKLIFTE